MKAWEALKLWQEKGLKCRPKGQKYYDYPENWDCIFGEEIDWEVEEKPLEVWMRVYPDGLILGAYKSKENAEVDGNNSQTGFKIVKFIEVKE